MPEEGRKERRKAGRKEGREGGRTEVGREGRRERKARRQVSLFLTHAELLPHLSSLS